MDNRKVISNCTRWPRFLLWPIFLAGIFQLEEDPQSWQTTAAVLLICAIVYRLIYKRRRLQYDDEALYQIWGKREVPIALKNIQSIKRSTWKINGCRYWKLSYLDNQNSRTIRFFGSIYNNPEKELHRAIEAANPNVIIWHHPYFHD